MWEHLSRVALWQWQRNEFNPFKGVLYFKVIPEKSRYSGHFLFCPRDWKDII